MKPLWSEAGPNVIAMLNQKILLRSLLLSNNDQDTSYRWCIWPGVVAGNLIHMSLIVLCLTTFCYFKNLQTMHRLQANHICQYLNLPKWISKSSRNFVIIFHWRGSEKKSIYLSHFTFFKWKTHCPWKIFLRPTGLSDNCPSLFNIMIESLGLHGRSVRNE